MKCGDDASRPMVSDAMCKGQLFLGGSTHARDASKLPQQRAGGRGRDSWDAGKDGLAGIGTVLGTQRVGRPVGWGFTSLAPAREQHDPSGGIGGIRAEENRYTQVDNGDEQTADRIGAKRAVVDRRALDKQKGILGPRFEATELGPERTVSHPKMEAANSLALDARATSHAVVPNRETLEFHARTSGCKSGRYAAWPFAHVYHHPTCRRLHHVSLPVIPRVFLVSVRSTDTGAVAIA